MDYINVSSIMFALGHESRLFIFHKLVISGSDGMNISDLIETVDLPPSTLAHHVRILEQADLIIQKKMGREIRNYANLEALLNPINILQKECCSGEKNVNGRVSERVYTRLK